MALLQTVTKKSDVLMFGKHKGQTIGNAILLWPSYVVWLCNEGIVKMPKRLRDEAAEKAVEEENRRVKNFMRSRIRDEMDGWDGWLDE
jgi:hypothetical protein